MDCVMSTDKMLIPDFTVLLNYINPLHLILHKRFTLNNYFSMITLIV